jgi:hypothetical protein
MDKKLIALSFALLIANIGAAPASNSSQMTSLHFLVGTWHCTTTMATSGAKSPATISVSETIAAHGQNWLRAAETVSRNGQSVGTDEVFFGYNARHGHWVIISIDAGGAYQVETSPSAALNGSAWTVAYPGRVHATSTFHTDSSMHYSSDSKWTSPRSGKTISSHEACVKQ